MSIFATTLKQSVCQPSPPAPTTSLLPLQKEVELVFQRMLEYQKTDTLNSEFEVIHRVNPDDILTLKKEEETELSSLLRIRSLLFKSIKPFEFGWGPNNSLFSNEFSQLLGKEIAPSFSKLGDIRRYNPMYPEGEMNVLPILLLLLEEVDAMLAGGSLSRAASNKGSSDFSHALNGSDFDLFFTSGEELQKALVLLRTFFNFLNRHQTSFWCRKTGKLVSTHMKAHVKNITSKAITVDIDDTSYPASKRQTIQLIYRDKEETFEEILSNFDLQSSMIGYYKGNLLHHKDFDQVINHREMVFSKVAKNKPQAFLLRLEKHVKRNMKLPEGDQSQIFKFIVENFTKENCMVELEHLSTSYEGEFFDYQVRIQDLYVRALASFSIAGNEDDARAALLSVVSTPIELKYVEQKFNNVREAYLNEIRHKNVFVDPQEQWKSFRQIMR